MPPSIQETHEKLKKIRASTTLTLKPTPLLKEEILGSDGKLSPFKLRYYQCQGIYHLLVMARMVLGDDTGLGKCVRGDTQILTDRGMVRIDSLQPQGIGEESTEGFYEPSGPTRVWTGRRMAAVRRFYWSGVKSTIRVTTRNGFRIEGSHVHPVVVRRGNSERFIKLSEVQEGDFACIDRSAAPFPETEPRLPFDVHALDVRCTQYRYPDQLSPDLAALLGYIVGEGNRMPHGIVVTQHVSLNPQPHAEIRSLFDRVFGWSGNHTAKNRDTTIHVSSVGIKRYLALCGVNEELSRDKSVPWCVKQGTRASVQSFLSTLFEAEASVADGGVEISSASEDLLVDVQRLLLRFGIVGTLTPKRIEGRDHTYWKLTFFGDDARTFDREIGFRSSRKIEPLHASLAKRSNPNKDVIPDPREDVEALRVLIQAAVVKSGANARRTGSGLKQFGVSFQNTLAHIRSGRRDVTYDFLGKLLGIAADVGLHGTAAYNRVEEVVQRRFFYDPIVRIDHDTAAVMDIEIDDPDHCFVSNGFVSHNTIELLGALCYLWAPNKEPHNKVIVVTPKSALRQWAAEVAKFTNGIRCYVASGTPDERRKIYEAWAKHPTGPDAEKAILLVNYAILQRDWDVGAQIPRLPNGKPDPKGQAIPGLLDRVTASASSLVVVFDECHAFKNTGTKTWQTCFFLSQRAKRCYGMTATLLKNRLEEGFAIYKVIVPPLFSTRTRFLEDYCVTKLQPVPGGRKIPIVVGYRRLDQFRDLIDPYFLGRAKQTVSTELPRLITREIQCEMTAAEDTKYKEALSGLLELGDGETKDFSETVALTSLIYTQQIVDSMWLLKFKGGDEITTDMFGEDSTKVKDRGSKEEALAELISGELDSQKVIIYTRFEKLVGRLQAILKEDGVKSVRITGKENDKKRQANKELFQDFNSDIRVIFITDAGSEAINLQSASALIFFDAPWSWGNYAQLLGRPIRIGSVHDTVVAYHLVAERPKGKYKDRKTIDHHVLSLLGGKKNLVEKVLGSTPVGALDFSNGEKAAMKELLKAIQKSEREAKSGVPAAVTDTGM